jgi:autotransporter strand-loop-strand O-heptosyltransferase
MSDLPGNYYEPDFNHLSEVMRFTYENYEECKKQSLVDSHKIHKDFSWERIGEIGYEKVLEFWEKIQSPDYIKDTNEIKVSFFEGPRVDISGDYDQKYKIEFIDSENDEVVHTEEITNNMWTACGRKYYTKWKVKVNGVVVKELDLKDKTVLISFESKSIGDTLAWAPYVVDFSKKHQCKVVLSTFHNQWFEGLDEYSEITFIKPGSVINCDHVYRIGWFKSAEGKWDKFDLYPNHLNSQPLQKTATDILGLPFEEKNYGINFKPKNRPFKNKYIVFSPESTAGCKEWTYDGWKSLSKMLKKEGYEIVVLTTKSYTIDGARNVFGKSLEESMNILYHAEYLVGLSSGLSWINWCLGKHTVMISGFTAKDHEFKTNNTRIQNEHSCNSCWANSNLTFDAGDWHWCPIWRGTDKQHICNKSISPLTVYNMLPK